MSDKSIKQYPNESLFPFPSWPSAEAKASSTNICQEDPQRDAVEERNGQISAEWQTSDELTGKCIAYTSKHVVSQLPGCLTGKMPHITANDDGFIGELSCWSNVSWSRQAQVRLCSSGLCSQKFENIWSFYLGPTRAQTPDCGFA